jgi:hypothetical protein
MPVKYCKIESNRLRWCRCRQYSITHCLIHSTNKHVETVKTSSQIKSTPINCITKCKTCRSVFNILTVHKKSPLSNSNQLVSSTKIFFVVIKCMFCSICSKVRCLLDKGICFGQTSPMQRYYTNRRPSHTDLNSWHECSMHKCPLQTNKKSSFTNNKLEHSKLQSSSNFRCVVI